MRKLIVLTLLAATLASAEEPRKPFPDDYTPSPCAQSDVCRSFDAGMLANAGSSMLGLSIDKAWLKDHLAGITQDLGPLCAKIATCNATPGNFYQFCDDTVVPEARRICDKYPKNSRDHEQCSMYVETFILGVDQQGKKSWEAAQKCGWEKTPKVVKNVPPVVWMEPAKIARDYTGYITFYSYDPDTKVPVPAHISIENQKLFAPTNPAGNLATYYPFKWPVKFNRKPSANGHRDVVAPMITIEADGFTPVKFAMPIDVPKMTLEMQPAKLKPGKNTVTITAKDAETGEPVEARVMYGELVAGETNVPFVLDVKKGKRPELWVTSLFNRYSDAVVAPAK